MKRNFPLATDIESEALWDIKAFCDVMDEKRRRNEELLRSLMREMDGIPVLSLESISWINILELSKEVNAFDWTLLESVFAQLLKGDCRIEGVTLATSMSGKLTGVELSDRVQERIYEGMKKLLGLPVTTTCPVENGEMKRSAPMLSSSLISGSVDGKKFHNYVVFPSEMMYSYSVDMHCLVIVPREMLAVPVKNTLEHTVLLRTMMRMVAPYCFGMQAKYQTEDECHVKIEYQTLVDAVRSVSPETELDAKTFRKEVLDTAHTILAAWKEEGYVTKWTDIPAGRQKAEGKNNGFINVTLRAVEEH